MYVLSICSLKGGVGKTSVALGLASAALHRDIPTLVVDLDPQGDATIGLDVAHQPTNVASALLKPRKAVIDEATATSGWTADSPGTLDVLTGGSSVADLDQPSISAEEARRLRHLLPKMRGYDLVIIDCPPSLNGLTTMGLVASDRAIVVTEPGLFAVAAADRALRAIDGLRRAYAPRLQPLGIVINRVRVPSVEHEYRIAELGELFGPLVMSPTIPDRAGLQQAQGAARPLHTWPTAGAKELATLFDALLSRALRAVPDTKRPTTV